MADSTFEILALRIKEVFEEEFAPEGFKMVLDNIHEALGRYRVAVGVAPTDERAWLRDRQVSEHTLEVKFYGLWTDEIDPETVVNPLTITGYAERFKRALRVAQVEDPGTGQMWFYDIDRIQYPNDPTGNKSRFIATIRAFGNNTNLIETTA